jgi:sorbitol-specific phosphotransferase system component IIC
VQSNLIALFQSRFYSEIIFFGIFPVLLGLLIALFWVLFSFCQKKESGEQRIEDLRLKVCSSFLVIIYVLYPSIATQTFSLFDCVEGPHGK